MASMSKAEMLAMAKELSTTTGVALEDALFEVISSQGASAQVDNKVTPGVTPPAEASAQDEAGQTPKLGAAAQENPGEAAVQAGVPRSAPRSFCRLRP